MTIAGDIAIAAGLAVAGTLGWLAARSLAFKSPLSALVPLLVGGAAQENLLLGRYDGLPVRARVADASGPDAVPDAWEVVLSAGPGSVDWSLVYTGEKFLGTGVKAWRVKSRDEELAQRLTQAGGPALLRDWVGQPQITYQAKSGALVYRVADADLPAVPAPDAFQAQLDLLARLARLNREANAPDMGNKPDMGNT